MGQRLTIARDPAPNAKRAAEEERDRMAATLDQLERAELYVVAALDLQADDRARGRLIEDLRAEIVAVRRALARPSVVP